MIVDKGIPIKNVYYMLTYAFKELRHNNYEKIAGEMFEDIQDLFAEILSLGIAYLLKQGLHREYIANQDELQTLRGKLSIGETIKKRLKKDTRLVCDFDTFSENNIFNQILKSCLLLLLRNSDVSAKRKAKLKRMLIYFDGVNELPSTSIRWDMLRYDRNTRTYQMLHSLCYFLLNSRLLSTDTGEIKIEHFSDEHMNLLFQRFIMEYYKKKHPDYRARAKQIKWDLCEKESVSTAMLPVMQTDITLTLGGRTLIIDAKYYSQSVQENMGKNSIHSPNLYQIHTYVTNEDIYHTGMVDGLLLYARTETDVQPDLHFKNHDGNIFMVKTLDLSQDFKKIEEQLERIPGYKT